MSESFFIILICLFSSINTDFINVTKNTNEINAIECLKNGPKLQGKISDLSKDKQEQGEEDTLISFKSLLYYATFIINNVSHLTCNDVFGGTTSCKYLHPLLGNNQATQKIEYSKFISFHQLPSKLDKEYYFITKHSDQLHFILPKSQKKLRWFLTQQAVVVGTDEYTPVCFLSHATFHLYKDNCMIYGKIMTTDILMNQHSAMKLETNKASCLVNAYCGLKYTLKK